MMYEVPYTSNYTKALYISLLLNMLRAFICTSSSIEEGNTKLSVHGLGTKIAEGLLTLSYFGLPQAPGNDCSM